MFRSDHHPDARRHHRGPGWGPGQDGLPSGFGRWAWREGLGRGRMRRGEIRPLVLSALATRPMHGYEVIQELETRSGGRWRPSAGSVYPTLQLLADEGLVTSEELDGRRVYRLTQAGETAAAASPEPWAWRDRGASDERDAWREARQLMGAVAQVGRIGSEAADRETARILADARRRVYRLLAEDGQPADDQGADDQPAGTPTADESAAARPRTEGEADGAARESGT